MNRKIQTCPHCIEAWTDGCHKTVSARGMKLSRDFQDILSSITNVNETSQPESNELEEDEFVSNFCQILK